MDPANEGSGGSVSGTIDRSGSPTGDQQAAQENARAQEALHNQVLQSEMASIKAGVAAFGEGTAERLAALQRYASAAKQYYGSGNVDEVRKANEEVLVAERQYRQTQGAEAIADARTQAQALQANTSMSLAERLNAERAIWTAVLANDKLNNAQRLQAAREFSSEYTAIAKETAAQAATITRQDVSADIAISRMKIEAEKNTLQLGTAANAQAVAERLSQLRALTATEFSLNEQALENELTTLNALTPAYNAVYNEIRQLKAKLVLDLQALDKEAAEASKKYAKEQSAAWKIAGGEIENAEGTLVGDVLNRRKTMAQSLQQIGLQIVQQEISNDLKALTSKYVLQNSEKALAQGGLLFQLKFNQAATAGAVQSQAAQTSAVVAGNTARTTAQATATAESKSMQAAAGASQVMSDAAKAAAGAYSALAGIPIIGPFVAPVAAGVAYAAVAGWESAASLDVGTNYVPRDMLANIHEGEAVVPKEYNPAAGGAGEGAGGDYSHHEQHNYGGLHVKALDARGFGALIKGAAGAGHRQALAKAGRQYINRGGGRAR